jgi:hypothetical protein
VGQIISRLRVVRPLIWLGYILASIGYALWYRFFAYGAALSVIIGLQIIPGFGMGLSMQPPMLILQAAMPLDEMASVTSAFFLSRSLGGCIGESNELRRLEKSMCRCMWDSCHETTPDRTPRDTDAFTRLSSLHLDTQHIPPLQIPRNTR